MKWLKVRCARDWQCVCVCWFLSQRLSQSKIIVQLFIHLRTSWRARTFYFCYRQNQFSVRNLIFIIILYNFAAAFNKFLLTSWDGGSVKCFSDIFWTSDEWLIKWTIHKLLKDYEKCASCFEWLVNSFLYRQIYYAWLQFTIITPATLRKIFHKIIIQIVSLMMNTCFLYVILLSKCLLRRESNLCGCVWVVSAWFRWSV